MEIKEISPSALRENIFDALSKEWMLLTTEREGKINTMTVGWGGIGVMWGKNVVYAVVRPERYTHELLEESEHFSMSVLEDGHREKLGYCGRNSGRDRDKIEECGFKVLHSGETPYFEEARLTFVCRKLFASDFTAENFLGNSALIEKWYGGGYHTLYIAEIERILIKE